MDIMQFRKPPHNPEELPRKPIQIVGFYKFGEEIDIDQFEFYGYLMGDKVDRCKTLTIYHFDIIEFIQTSTNAIKGGEFIHAIGRRSREGSQKPIILIKKKPII